MLKKLLGLEDSDITDEEIVAKIKEAQKNNQDYIEFIVGDDIVRVKIPNNISCPDPFSKGD